MGGSELRGEVVIHPVHSIRVLVPAVFELRDRLGSTQVTVTTAYGVRGTPQRRCWAFYRPVTSYRHGCRLRLSTFLLASHDESSGLVPGSAVRWSVGGCAVRQCPKLHRIRYRVERLPNQGLHRRGPNWRGQQMCAATRRRHPLR